MATGGKKKAESESSMHLTDQCGGERGWGRSKKAKAMLLGEQQAKWTLDSALRRLDFHVTGFNAWAI